MFQRLSMQNDRYFNAGVMIINYKEWKVQEITKKLLNKMTQLNQKIVFWDQDVLNSLFDGKFLELNNNLNYNLRLTEKNSNKKIPKKVQDEMILIHYSGSFKPWTVRGAYNVNSYYYHNVFKEINGKAYHIVSKWRLGSLKQFIKGILKLNIIFIKRPLSFIKYALLSIFIDDRPL
jgi:lipopolysaccharide biosynthesis glycosyltransferase